MNIPALLITKTKTIDRALDRYLPLKKAYPKRLHQAMRYAIFSGGKRVRPFLVLEAARVCGGHEEKALPLACALEMIHTYSLIHDDLPSMDDDQMRRGKLTCHMRFDEATAILAGDALLSHAFDVMTTGNSISPERRVQVMSAVAYAIGPHGMVAGQAADMQAQEKKQSVNLATMNRINGYKTGQLIQVSVRGGALWGGGTPTQVKRLTQYGQSIGFLFQVVDDIIDGDGYAALAGEKAAYRKASQLRDEAKTVLKSFGRRGEVLLAFADFLYERKK